MRTRLPLALLTCLVVAVSAGPASAATKKPIYVSLGDSLAWSYSKADDGSVVRSDSGYTELLAAKARGTKRYGRKLTVKKFGCPGESTASYLGATKTVGAAFDCGFKKSQHADALAYIKKNRKRIGFITISIGANNFTPCAPALGSVDILCVQKGNEALDRDLPKIFRDLRKAAGKKVLIAAPNLYNPYLALFLRGAEYRELALLTIDLSVQIGSTIERFAKQQKIRVADTLTAFRTTDVTRVTQLNGQSVPVAAAQICAYTFMCRPAPVGPDIHPNDAGYGAIATAFQKALKIN